MRSRNRAVQDQVGNLKSSRCDEKGLAHNDADLPADQEEFPCEQDVALDAETEATADASATSYEGAKG